MIPTIISKISTAFHATLAVVLNGFWVFAPLPPPSHPFYTLITTLAGPFNCISFINLLMQAAYFLLAVANDAFGSDERRREKQSRLQRWRDWAFTSLVFPVGQFVSFVFWVLYLINRELILPSTMDVWFPAWLNHVMHTLPAFAGLAEQVLVYHTHQRGSSRLLPLLSLYAVYLAWFFCVRVWGGFWIYPVFALLSEGEICVFLGLLSVPALFFFVAGERIHVAVWGLEPESCVDTEEKVKLR